MGRNMVPQRHTCSPSIRKMLLKILGFLSAFYAGGVPHHGQIILEQNLYSVFSPCLLIQNRQPPHHSMTLGSRVRRAGSREVDLLAGLPSLKNGSVAVAT